MVIREVAIAQLVWRNGDHGKAGLPHPQAFVGPENEQLIVKDRATCGAAELILAERALDAAGKVVKEVVGVGLLVVQVFVDFAMELIGAGLGDDIDGGGAITELGVRAGDVDLDFLDRRRRLLRRGLPVDRALHVDAVDGDVRSRVAIARRKDARGAEQRARLVAAQHRVHRETGEGGLRRNILQRNVGENRGQVEEVAAVEWQVLHQLVDDGARHLRGRGVDHLRACGRDGHRLAYLPDLEDHVDLSGL